MESTSTNEWSPDNPRPWDPNHPLLKSRGAPHETNGVMRVHRAGFTGNELRQQLKMKPMAISKALSRAMDEEQVAAKQSRDIFCPTYPGRKRQ
ncbi:hypothetical protein PBI_MYXUS_73 [Mycobacterium phage Myxus]|uniref:Gp68-like predicted RNA polymerase component domain-containing protein n=5 Tax=Fromanvirus packman TaxID=1034142 RepID=G1BR78_9CAUD|nr:hypothetical protein AVV05_gp036 [Mycobacterium phage Pioneer]YP_009636042.1 hypothetical protein FGG56_gp31 [Mycobacterium phage PackMan]AMO43941.1 hypothetical protein PBI_MYXUS_73 [Mycobacterium phage Myxus]AOQ29030.1 hypothetical protein SEA_HORTUMSL17_74 [Mycobacterium phage HortumSL17]AOY12025.1 hypothetical protein SEA_PHAEDER_73 [Mycobacterium phage Phaeder]AVI04179.1 hypothetical protein SEA_PHONNEGUT_73 [Mycobacterium phage Phonnegut]AVI04407.1 hypothetical protein SEA_SCHERZO_72